MKNSFINLFGMVAPALVAVVAIPLLVQGLGTDRFGILTIAWAAIGYFTIFDLGIGRALTQLVAGWTDEDDSAVPGYVWTALLLMVVMGSVGSVVLLALAPWLVGVALKIPPDLQGESLRAFYLLGASLPFVISTAGLRGLLEAHQRFGIVNAIRVPMGVLTFVAPLFVLPFTASLEPVIGALVASRVLGWAVHLFFCLRTIPALRSRPSFRMEAVRRLAQFGGWLTVSNFCSSVMVYLDRFLIGALLSMAAVAYYATPYEAVTKLWLVPGALIGVLFPAFATSYVRDHALTRTLLDRAFRFIFLGLFPLVFIVVLFAQEGLALWMGGEFSANSTTVLQWLAVGVLVNSLGMVPAAALQAVGRPDITGKLNLLEMPVYVALVWLLIGTHGIVGAAVAWAARIAFDTVALCLLMDRVLGSGHLLLQRFIVVAMPGVVLLALATVPMSMPIKVAALAAFAVAFLLVGWRGVVTPEERRALLSRAAARREHPASV